MAIGPVTETLSGEDCRRHLAEGGIGQVALTIGALPVVQPAFFALKDGFVVIRSPEHSALSRAVADNVVAFGVYHFDGGHQDGWSVLVRGKGERVTDPALAGSLQTLRLRCWGDEAGSDCFVRVPLTQLSGTRVHWARESSAVHLRCSC